MKQYIYLTQKRQNENNPKSNIILSKVTDKQKL